nr:MAG TPA: hypothetical protein [Caudoviricetes sp.]
MAKSYSIVKNRVNNPFQDMEAQKRQVDETGHIQYGYAAPSILERKPKEQPQPQKNSVMSSILNEVTGATLGDRSLVPASVVVPKSPNAQADYEDARRRLWAYQNDQEAQKAAKEKERAYNQAMSEGATGTGATYQDETLARLQREVKDTQQRYESEKTAAHDRYIHDQDAEDLDSMTPEERETLTSYGNYLKLQRADASSEMGPEPGEEEAVPREYQALVEKYGASRLAELYETASRDAALEQRQQVQQAAQRQSQGAVGGTLASLATIPASVVGGGLALMSRLKDSQNSTGRYKTLSPYTAGDAVNVWSDSVRQNVGQQIAGDGSNIFRQGAAVLYQAGLGTVDSVAKAIVLGPAAAAATSAMGSYARTLSDASEKGAPASQAVLLATANAALDYAMDKIPLDQLAGLAKSGSTSALKAALKQAGIEVTTEGASFLGSQILEMEILQGNSEYARNIQAYMSQGLSQPDATFQANKDLIAQAGQQMLVAGLSGGISAGVSTAVGNRRNRSATEDATEDATAIQDATAATEAPAAQPAPEPLQEPPLPEPLPQQPSPQPDTLPQAAQPQEKPIATVSRMAEDIGANATARQQQTQENLRSVQDQVASLTGSADAAPSVGAADRDFTGKAHYEDLLSDDNVKPARRDDFRGDEVPEMDGSQRVSDVAKTLIGSKNTTDAAADQVKDLISSGVFSYDKKTNQQSLREAIDDLNTRGTQAVRDDILHHLARNTIEDGDVAKAVALTNQYIQSGDEAAAKEMMTDLTLLAQKSGRNLQLFSLIRRMSPEGQLDVIQQTADKMLSSNQKVKLTKEERAAARRGQTVRPKQALVKADIPAELKNQYIEAARAKDSARIQAATEAIAQAVGAQYHATFKEKWNAWRYMCMLGNASTNVRNVAGNAFMMPYAAAKDKLAAAFEKFLPQEQRTKALHTDSDLLSWAKEDVKTVEARNALKYSAKVGADVTQDIMSENKQIFKTKALETARKAAEWAPSAGDMLFKNGYYERYLANFLTARGIKRADIDSGNVSPEILAQARQYAVDNAYVNTFNDRNSFSDAISSVGKWKASSNPVTRAFGTAIDGILPFRRTPANILVRFKEYSPIEFLSAGKKLKDGKITASEFCNSLATGITGSAAMGLGAALAHGITDSKGNGVRLISKATEEEKLQGKQDYSVEVTVNGKTYSFTVDWAAPANLPLFVGTNLYKAVTENGEDGGDFVDGLIRVADATKDTLEPMLSLSCLSSVNDLLENIKYSEDGSHIYKIAASAATSYLTQGIPSLLRQTGTFLQTEKQTTFANDDRKAVRDVQRTLSNVPFVGDALGLKTDKIDVWGNKISTGTVGQRAFNAYLNPSKISKVTSDAVTRELSRLAATDYGTGVTPEVAAKTLTYTDKQGVAHKDVRLTASQWETYATTKGKTSKSILDSLVKSSDYAKLTDAAKAEVVKLVYSYADKQGAVKAMPDSDGLPETWMEEAQQSKNPGKYIIQKVNNQQMKSALDALTNAWAHNSERPAAVKSLEEAYSAYSKSSSDIRKAVMDAAEGTAKTYLEARAEGLASNTSLAIIKQVQSIPKKDRQKAAYQYQAVAKTKGLTETQQDTAMKLYMKDGSSTETKYDYIRQELGLSPKEYADAYYAYSYTDTDGDNKTFKPEAIQGIMDLGYSRQEATELYSIYKGSSNAAKKKLADFKESNE